MVRPEAYRAAGDAAHRVFLAGLAASLLLAFAPVAPSAAAQGVLDPAASTWVETGQGKVRLVAATPQLGAANSVKLGLEFHLAPGWDIYWRAPGDAGLPPQLDWKGSRNLAAPGRAWPPPPPASPRRSMGRARAPCPPPRFPGPRRGAFRPMGSRRSATRAMWSCRSPRGWSGPVRDCRCTPHSNTSPARTSA